MLVTIFYVLIRQRYFNYINFVLKFLYMEILSLFFLSLALSVDSFLVALSVGFCNIRLSKYVKIRFIGFVSIFHIILFIVGLFLGEVIVNFIKHYDFLLSSAIFSLLGLKMLIDGFYERFDVSSSELSKLLSIGGVAILSSILSIDALIAGVSYTSQPLVELYDLSQFYTSLLCAIVIGIIVGVVSWIGYYLAFKVKNRFNKYSQIFGGAILLALAIKILIENLII